MSPWVFKNEEGKSHTHWTKHYSLVLFKTCSPLNHPHQFLSSYLWSSIMDNRRREILCSLVIFMVLKYVIVSTMAIQKTIMYHHNTSIMMMAYFLWRRSLYEANRVSALSWGHITYYNLTASNRPWPDRTATNSSSLTQALDHCLFATKLLKLVWLRKVLGNLKVTETWRLLDVKRYLKSRS